MTTAFICLKFTIETLQQRVRKLFKVNRKDTGMT